MSQIKNLQLRITEGCLFIKKTPLPGISAVPTTMVLVHRRGHPKHLQLVYNLHCCCFANRKDISYAVAKIVDWLSCNSRNSTQVMFELDFPKLHSQRKASQASCDHSMFLKEARVFAL